MRMTLAIARRDLLSAFATPLAWVLASASGLLAAVVFVAVGFEEGEIANLRPALVALGWATLLLAPAVAMRSVAEERRQGTLEVLGAAPLGEWSIVLGKFLAAVGVLAVVLLPIAVLAVPLERHGDPDFGEIACGLLGLLLVGSTIASMGILASSLASSQVLAYLGAMFPWLGLVLAAKLLPRWLGAEWTAPLEAIDPLRRLDAFVIGLLDLANVAYFAAAIACFLALAALALGAPRRVRPFGVARLGRVLHGAIRILALGAAAVAVVAIASRPELRVRMDLTRTRAYSLSTETRELLASLPGEWSIELLVIPEEGDRALLAQIDEVLRRFAEVNPRIRVGRIDPTDPRDLAAYESLLERLAASHAEESRTYEDAVAEGLAGLDELVSFAAAEAPRLKAQGAALEGRGDDRRRAELAAASALLEQIAATGPPLKREIESLVETSTSRPFPDWESARSALVAHHRLRSDQLAAALPRDAAARTLALRLRRSMDRLEQLPPSRLGEVATAVAAGEAAVVSGPEGAATIPGWQLLPRSTFRDEETVRFDRRFRGEQLLAAAIRSLGVESPPVVVVLHAEPASLLRRSTEGGDLLAIADELRAARFEVREWSARGGAPSAVEEGRTVVFLVVPPLRRSSLEPDDAERALLAEVERRIGEGHPVMLSVAPSVLPLLGGRDPWVALAGSLGVEADTSRTLLELAPGEDAPAAPQATHLAAPSASTHPVGAALAGQDLLVFYPVPISPREGVTAVALGSLEAKESRWLEEDWRRVRGVAEVPAAKRQVEPLPVALAAERALPDGRVQRSIVVGSNGWMLTSLADRTVSLGGERVAFANPGNRELARSGAAWLAGLDAWIAAGGAGREVSRLTGLDASTRAWWIAGLLVVLPVAPLVAGGIVLTRRDRTR